jgi:hypothetical protein
MGIRSLRAGNPHQHELAALGLGDRGCDRDLAAELVRRSGLALADAFDLRGVLMDWIAGTGSKVAALVDIDEAIGSGQALRGFAAALEAFDANRRSGPY